MTTADVDFAGHVIHVPAEDLAECQHAARAISELGPAIANTCTPYIQRIAALEKEVSRRQSVARAVKFATLGCAAVLVLGFAPQYARALGGGILFLSIIDYVFGNHQRLLGAMEDLAGHRAVLDFSRGMDRKRIEVIRHVGTNPKTTLEAYYQYLLGVLDDINAGVVQLRKRIEARETELARRLAPPEPTAALVAEGAGRKNDGNDS